MTDAPKMYGGIEISSTKKRVLTKNARLSMLIVSSAGVGKTTLAATAPGNKLYMMFEPDGDASLPVRDDLMIAEMSDLNSAAAEQLISTNPFNIADQIDHHKIDTVIIDSLTAVSDLALDRGIAMSKGATIARPSLQGYGMRNAYTLRFIRNMISLTAKKNVHVIFIAHEDIPTINDDGIIQHISIMLGGKLPEVSAKDISEVWWIYDQTKKKTIGVRPVRMRKPAKTRMFKTTQGPEFTWVFDPDTWKGEGISTWYDAWKANNFNKIDLPNKGK